MLTMLKSIATEDTLSRKPLRDLMLSNGKPFLFQAASSMMRQPADATPTQKRPEKNAVSGNS